MTRRIPLVDLAAQHAGLQGAIEEATARVLRSGVYVLGPEVRAFEAELAAYVGVPHAVACASGTDALTLALLAMGLRAGDEVIVPALTFQSDAEAVSLLGGVPRFADIDPRTCCIDPQHASTLVTARTRAIIPTHLYGLPADMDAVRELAASRGLTVIEDACQAIGSRYKGRGAGGLGDVGCFSFFPTKNLGACGDGGALTTHDEELAGKVRRLRNHGAREKHVHEAIGLNSRLDELQAAILRVKLRQLDAWTARRRALAARYDRALEGAEVTRVMTFGDRLGNAHLYTIRARDRDALRAALAEQGIETAVHYPRATFDQPVYADLARGSECPHAVVAAAEVMSLPMFPEMDDGDVDRVADAVARWARPTAFASTP